MKAIRIYKIIKHFVVLILFALHLTCFAQHTLGVKAGGGLSKIPTARDEDLTVQKNYFTFSDAEGVYYDFRLKKRHSFSAELLFAQVRGKERLEYYSTGQAGNLTGYYFIEDYNRFISYVGIPVYYNFRHKGLHVNLGFQAMLAMKSRGRLKGENGQNSVSTPFDTKVNNLNISNYSYGPRAGLIVRVYKKLSAEAVLYYGINTVLADEPAFSYLWKIQQLTIGIKYRLYQTEYDPKKVNAVLE